MRCCTRLNVSPAPASSPASPASPASPTATATTVVATEAEATPELTLAFCTPGIGAYSRSWERVVRGGRQGSEAWKNWRRVRAGDVSTCGATSSCITVRGLGQLFLIGFAKSSLETHLTPTAPRWLVHNTIMIPCALSLPLFLHLQYFKMTGFVPKSPIFSSLQFFRLLESVSRK